MKVAIIGATAYTSLELIKLLTRHPEAEIIHLGGRREEEPKVSEIFPPLKGVCEMTVRGMPPADIDDEPDVAFFTLPHGTSQLYVPQYLEKGIRCIDFSADYRFDDLKVYQQWYGEHSDQANFGSGVYGIPELFRSQIAEARLVANPGCYPTAVALALAPLVKNSLLETNDIIVDAKSGVSGRGNKPERGSMFCECNENVAAYSVGCHRHEPEMEHVLSLIGGRNPSVTFAPHLVPMDRGILATIYVKTTKEATTEQLHEAIRAFYEDEPFVRVLEPGLQSATKAVANTNYCDIAVVSTGEGRAVVTAAIDNLMKGASSQAVQNMNAMFGLPETDGLTT